MKATSVAAVLVAAVAAPAAAFVPSATLKHATSGRSPSGLSMVEKRAIKDFDSSQIQDDFSALIEGVKINTPAGVSGERGEAWAAAQVGILLFVILGNLPFLGGSLEVLAGPGLLLGGAGLALVSALQLGRNFSPWPEPAEGGVLNTTGVYSLCRHPMYAGLVAFSLGLGFTTDSFTRIALACLLGYVLDRKAGLEEEKLVAVHPAYKTYKEEVSKFVPTLY
ncbi:unnamed protein product [Scytosiphon promiscuus]